MMDFARSFPATHVAHWPAGPVECCERHAQQIAGLGRIMGCHVAINRPAPDGSQCVNCVNEAKNQLPLLPEGS